MTAIKLLTIVEATTINAVAKTVLEFYRSARELNHEQPDFPLIEGCVVTFDRGREINAPPNDFVVAARELGLDVEIIPERRRLDLKVIPALRGIVESRGPDIVVTNSVKSHFLVWRSRLWRQHPWVAFHHGYTDTDRKMRVYNRLDRWSLPHADRLVTVCHSFAKELMRSTGVSLDKISVQHNAIRRQPSVSTADVTASRRQFRIGADERVVLSVGRLSREKAHIDLLEAFTLLRETKPDISLKLIIVGDGPERARLETVAESLGCKDRVAFAGQVSDVQPFYAMADVFALPSLSEGSPNVLLEAMAANVPIVATAVGGVPEMVSTNESGLLVPPNDPPSLAAALATLLTDKDLAQRLAKEAATLVDTQYTPESYVRSLVEIYSEVIEGRRTH
ncbi:MAG TPA: glycosyltransferase [Pyrinomonadaceae bacterium]|nr:glycosyltransferase [Pyrinomonadaceae bacterium]